MARGREMVVLVFGDGDCTLREGRVGGWGVGLYRCRCGDRLVLQI
jgi:hypothetical protein